MLLATREAVPLGRGRDVMFARGDKRTMILAVVLAAAMLAVAVPTYEMIGCNMGRCTGMTGISTQPGSSFGSDCGGEWLANSAVAGIVPGGLTTALLVLIVAIASATAALSPRTKLQPIRLVRANAPPPPLDPRGERFTL
jgi:hypothetical protein